jgi:2-polyprenyl-6-methoxyphenol hydroxylase-like FAD-dependent oxidoreductase
MSGSGVLIVGGGPVGLVCAIDLARRGVAVTVVETRYPAEVPSAKCNHVSARTMEMLRRLGIADEVRAAGLPQDFPHDVVFRTRMTGREMARIVLPSPDGRRRGEAGDDTHWETPEPAHRINQIYFEPILYRHAAATPGVTLLNRHEAVSLEQDAGGVTLAVRALDGGAEQTLRARYLIGCDGGRSMVRRAIGGRLVGDPVIQRVQSSHIRMPGLLAAVPAPKAWMTYCYNTQRAGTVLAIDGREEWLVHNYLLPHEEPEAVDRDRCIRAILGVGADAAYEVIRREDWIGRRLVADRFRDRRVFLAGDAAHLWVPYGGYGMNAGIADGLGLTWLLAAHLAGWAPDAILDAYAAERQPITEQVSRFAMSHAERAIRERTTLPPEIEEEGEAGEAARRRVGEAAYRLNVQQFAAGGLNFGYYYDASPIIAYDDAAAPAYTMADYTSSTVPGCRVPHVTLPGGWSLYDAIGPDHAVLVTSAGHLAAGRALCDAAGAVGMPMRLVDLSQVALPACYDRGLVVARPDLHVGWRGDRLPSSPAALIDRLRGAASSHDLETSR